jgi:hypothetical protein
MSRILRLVAIVAVLAGLGLRVGEVHAHEGALHPDSCAMCRALQTPLVVPQPSVEAPLLVSTDCGAPVPAAAMLPGAPPILDGRLLRAPPCA